MYEKCEKIAKNALGKITSYEERDDAFIFYNDDMKQDGCVVIMKSNKKILTMSEYVFRSIA